MQFSQLQSFRMSRNSSFDIATWNS